ncbi:MAG: hypothetical protein A2017_06510 [Lentisphaerae bacterium GWF2_44_16]|nr:MAG: hypothetical protein A2017_06510 [Lentisphaerae bacterium GWF2_44_16]
MDIRSAIRRAYHEAGTQEALERKTGVAQGILTRYLSGSRDADNMRVSTLRKLFPEMKICFFRDEQLSGRYPETVQEIISIVEKMNQSEQNKILSSLSAKFPQYVTDVFSASDKRKAS